ncbi:hypothetical protein IT575_00210 [bacterium]|nr:hypothetical protein [bacterium]
MFRNMLMIILLLLLLLPCAAEGLVMRIYSPEDIPELLANCRDQQKISEYLGSLCAVGWGNAEIAALAQSQLDSSDAWTRRVAAIGVGRLGPVALSAVPRLRQLAAEDSEAGYFAAVSACQLTQSFEPLADVKSLPAQADALSNALEQLAWLGHSAKAALPVVSALQLADDDPQKLGQLKAIWKISGDSQPLVDYLKSALAIDSRPEHLNLLKELQDVDKEAAAQFYPLISQWLVADDSISYAGDVLSSIDTVPSGITAALIQRLGREDDYNFDSAVYELEAIVKQPDPVVADQLEGLLEGPTLFRADEKVMMGKSGYDSVCRAYFIAAGDDQRSSSAMLRLLARCDASKSKDAMYCRAQVMDALYELRMPSEELLDYVFSSFESNTDQWDYSARACLYRWGASAEYLEPRLKEKLGDSGVRDLFLALLLQRISGDDAALIGFLQILEDAPASLDYNKDIRPGTSFLLGRLHEQPENALAGKLIVRLFQLYWQEELFPLGAANALPPELIASLLPELEEMLQAPLTLRWDEGGAYYSGPQATAIAALGKIAAQNEIARRALLNLIPWGSGGVTDNFSSRLALIDALGEAGPEAAFAEPWLAGQMASGDPWCSIAAARALYSITGSAEIVLPRLEYWAQLEGESISNSLYWAVIDMGPDAKSILDELEKQWVYEAPSFYYSEGTRDDMRAAVAGTLQPKPSSYDPAYWWN